MITGTVQTIAFDKVHVHVAERFVLSIFRDGSHALLDVARSDNAAYRAIAATCGYDQPGRDFDRYARHHDLTHHWLAHQHGRASPTLWAVARGDQYPGADREEHHVNCLQRLWADREADIPWRPKEMDAARDALGSDWRMAAAGLFRLLATVD